MVDKRKNRAKALVDRMVNALNDHVIEGQEEFWTDDMIWYGPAGIGTKRGLRDFQENHQRPFLHGFSDKHATDEIRIAEGDYVAAAGFQPYGCHIKRLEKTLSNFQATKMLVRDYFDALEQATPATVADVLARYTSDDYRWRGVYPFRELHGAEAVAEHFWSPLLRSLAHVQRRQDIFIGGTNKIGEGEDGAQWVMSMGHFMGLFDADWLGIPRTRKLATLRYAEFNCVKTGKITQTGLFVDAIGLMVQAGVNPLPPSTGAYFTYPGPRGHDGLLFDDAPEDEGAATLALVNKMVDDLNALNESGSMDCPPEVLERTWAEDMVWYGPAGIGATYTIPRYQAQHQLPFRNRLADKKFEGHVCRFAEGNFACFFGWPNLSNTPLGGWLGLPGGQVNAVMQVVDVYRREGEKLAENWVLIDIPYWLKQQGLDVLERTCTILNPAE